MEISDKTESWGKVIYRYRKLLPFVFIGFAMLALWTTTPFRISTSVHISLLASSVAVCAFILMYLSSRRDDTSFEATSAAGGIYSVVRNPLYASHAIMMLALALFTGIIWFFVVSLLAIVWVLEKMIHYEERAMIARYGDRFRGWCKTTNALLPTHGNWKPSTCRKPVTASLGEQFVPMLVSLAGFAAVDAVKSYRVDFTLGDFTSLVVVALIFVVAAAGKLLTLAGGNAKK